MIGSRLVGRVDSLGVDLRDGMNLLSCPLPRADVIYHLAAQTSVDASWYDPVHDADNFKMIVRLVQEYPKAKIIYANSAAAMHPISSPYGFSKWVCAEYLRTFHQDYVICTFPNIYGEKGGKSVVDIFRENNHVTIFGDGLQTRDFVHVDDIVDGLIKARYWQRGEYQMGSGIATTVRELAEGKHVAYAPARKEARESILRNDTPDWEPKINVKEYIKS